MSILYAESEVVGHPAVGRLATHDPALPDLIKGAMCPDAQVPQISIGQRPHTNLLMAGIDIKTVQYLAGHKRSRITLDIYAHLVYNRPEELIGKVRNAFGNTPDSEEEESDGNLEETQKVKV